MLIGGLSGRFLIFALLAGLVASATAFAQPTDPPADWSVRQASEKSKSAKTSAEYTEIIDLCRAALDQKPAASVKQDASRLLSWALNKRGDEHAKSEDAADTALEDYEAAIKADPSNWRALHNRGVSLASAGDYEKASADFDRVVKLQPKYASAWFNRAEINFLRGDYNNAVSNYSQALRLTPQDSATLIGRGSAYVRQRNYRAAIADYSAAHAVRPDPLALTYRAEAYSDMGAYGQAVRDYLEAVRLDPELGRAYQSSAWLRATCADPRYRHAAVALRSARKAVELDGDDFRYLDTLAAALATNDQFEEAVSTQEKAIAAAEDAPAELKKQMQERLALYRDNKPYRDRAVRTVRRRR